MGRNSTLTGDIRGNQRSERPVFARRLLRVLVAALSALSCESGLAAPKNPGSVEALVTDESLAPISGVMVQVSGVNSSGGTYYVGKYTGSNGRTTIPGIPAGQRLVIVTAPAQFAEGPDPLTRQVEVIRDQKVSVAFRLRRL